MNVIEMTSLDKTLRVETCHITSRQY